MKIILMILAVAAIAGGVYYWSMGNDVASSPEPESKVDVNAACEGALAYMTFESGESAEQFVAECKEGQHPEVIERYKAETNVGAGAAI